MTARVSRFLLVFFMNVQALIGKKIDQTQGFLEDGTRVPLSVISVGGNVVSQIKTADHEGYNAIQVGFEINKRPDKPTAGHIKKAGIEKTPRFFREIRADDAADVTTGTQIMASEVFEPGDIVDVSGTSKGKGFAGVVKRYRFHGGPRTHGQSDRERARGSSGSGTTPGRVYKGKKMAGRMGNERSTVKNLEILDIKEDTILVKGLIPGSKGSIVMIEKVGKKNKNFKPLWSEDGARKTEDGEQMTEGGNQITEEVQTVEETVQTPATTEAVTETKTENTESSNEEVKDAGK